MSTVPSSVQHDDLPFPLLKYEHWYHLAQQQVKQAIESLESCSGPTPIAEELRLYYLDRLTTCKCLLGVPLAKNLVTALAIEQAQFLRQL